MESGCFDNYRFQLMEAILFAISEMTRRVIAVENNHEDFYTKADTKTYIEPGVVKSACYQQNKIR
ncbi:hypothetical protein EfmAA242_08430 [Enterococcus faecium]|nr:hypothetical protein EfmAA242_08430 [Enterococcus faecium]